MATIHITGSPQEVERLLRQIEIWSQGMPLSVKIENDPPNQSIDSRKPKRRPGLLRGQIQVAEDFDEWDEEMLELLEGNNPLDPLNVWLDEKKNEGQNPQLEP